MKFWPWKRKPAQVEHKQNGITDQVVALERFGCKICGRLAYGLDAAVIILGDTMLLVCRRCLLYSSYREQINEAYARYDKERKSIMELWKSASLAFRSVDEHPY